MATMPIYGKNLRISSSPEPKMPWGWICINYRERVGLPKLLKCLPYVDVWPLYGMVKFALIIICMSPIHLYGKIVENFKRLLLWSRWANVAKISCGASLGWGNEILLKWSRSNDKDDRHAHIWPFLRQGQICFLMRLYGSNMFIWKMLRIHILDISSKDHDPTELKIDGVHRRV